MKELPLTDLKDRAISGHIRFIQENAMGNDIMAVDDEPTTDTLLPKDTPVTYDDKLWFNIEGSLFTVPLTAA